MDSQGNIRQLADGEKPKADEIMLTEAEASNVRSLSRDDRIKYYENRQAVLTGTTCVKGKMGKALRKYVRKSNN